MTFRELLSAIQKMPKEQLDNPAFVCLSVDDFSYFGKIRSVTEGEDPGLGDIPEEIWDYKEGDDEDAGWPFVLWGIDL